MTFDLIEYFVVFGIAIVIPCFLIWLFVTKKFSSKISKRVKIAVYILILVSPLLPYAATESQTFIWGKSITPAVLKAMKDISNDNYIDRPVPYYYMGSKLCYLKVLSITPWNATVYFVTYRSPQKDHPSSDHGYSGFTLLFKRVHGEWKYSGDPGYIWTDMSNVNIGPFPPYPSLGDFPLTRKPPGNL